MRILVASVVATCAAGAGLESLDLAINCMPAHIGSWLLLQRGLRSFRMASRVSVAIAVSLEGLTNLQQLDLCARPVKLLPGMSLPPSLTKLTLGDTQDLTPDAGFDDAVPKQLGVQVVCSYTLELLCIQASSMRAL